VATLLAEGISRSFRGVKALTDVTISIQRGRVTGLIGANGAGKSTLVNIISGYDRPDQGAVILDGTDITAQRSFKRSRSGVARTFQHGHIFRALTVLENVEVTALASGNRGKAARALSVSILDSLDLLDWATNPATHLPHGVERRLGVARALATSPSYLLLDEPAAGLNDGEMEHFKETIRALSAERQIGVLLIDHNMPLIFGVSDHIYVLGAGKNVLDGEPPVVRSDEKLASSYLGSMAATIAGG
jgi:branched-chain amino acid transport system ATP-binding protein